MMLPHRGASAQFVRYGIIGSTVFCIDVGSFQVLLWLHAPLPAATGASYLLGTAVHFTLNRQWNFRAFDRSFAHQARTYVVVAGALLLTTLAIVELGVHVLHFTPLEAKIAAIILNIPLGFLGHKHLSFGAGIRARFR